MWVSARPYQRWKSRSLIRGMNGGSGVVFVAHQPLVLVEHVVGGPDA